MIKRIAVTSLQPDMCSHDLNSNWIAHGSKKRQGKIGSQAVIDKIVELGIQHIYFDTEKGAVRWLS